MAKEAFPNAVIVADRFHFFSRLQKAVDNARRYLRRKYGQADELKQIKWLLLKTPTRLPGPKSNNYKAYWLNPITIC
jgi:transposase